MGIIFLPKEAGIYNGEKTASWVSGAVKMDSYVQKNEIRSLSNATQRWTPNGLKT